MQRKLHADAKIKHKYINAIGNGGERLTLNLAFGADEVFTVCYNTLHNKFFDCSRHVTCDVKSFHSAAP